MLNEYVLVEAMVRVETPKAILIIEEETGEEFWLPKSQIQNCDEEDFGVGCVMELQLPLWLAEEKGLN